MTTINVRMGLLWFRGGGADAWHGTWRFQTRWRTPIWQERHWWQEQLLKQRRYWRSGNTTIFFPPMTSALSPLKPSGPINEEGLEFLSETGKESLPYIRWPPWNSVSIPAYLSCPATLECHCFPWHLCGKWRRHWVRVIRYADLHNQFLTLLGT